MENTTKWQDSRGVPIKEGDILSYLNPNYPNRVQPLHGVVFSKKHNKHVLSIKRGKKYRAWKPMDRGIRHESRWTIIGNKDNNPELLLPE